MRRMPVLFGAAMLISAPGFAEDTIAKKDYVADPDIVLEAAVDAVNSAKADAKGAGATLKEFAHDEVVGFEESTKAALNKKATAREMVKEAGMAAVEAKWSADSALQFRSYKVSEETGKMLMAGSDSSAATVDVSAFFSGVEFEGKASAFYNPTVKRLLVRQTMANLIAMENVLADYRSAEREMFGHQVEIEAKFVEVNQNTMNELGFNWDFGSKSGGDLQLIGDWYLPENTSLLGDALRTSQTALNGAQAGIAAISKTAGSMQWDLYIRALEQADDSDVLSAPSVVARDGSTAIIQVGEEQMIPKSFEVDNQDTSPYVAYADWELELMGVFMEVTPELREEGLIDLSLHPVIKDMVGMDPYAITPEYAYETQDENGNPKGVTYAMAPVNAEMPYFRVRELETTVTVADGSTVGMGGLIYDKNETFADKVPVLGSIPFVGRLFRSEGERSEKRNLMIFVTASQVAVNGQTAAEIALTK